MLKLEKITKELRKEIIRISYIKKAHHIGSELSCIDILVILYFSIMNIKPSINNKRFRDFFLLSKGHAALALYVVLCKKGFFSCFWRFLRFAAMSQTYPNSLVSSATGWGSCYRSTFLRQPRRVIEFPCCLMLPACLRPLFST